MKNWLKKYWIEVLVVAILGFVYIICASPAFTWMNADSDGPEYVMDAIYFYPAHHTSAPLYLLTGHLFEMLPFGHIYWRMSIMSGLFTVGSLIFIYFIVRNLLADNKYKRYWALLAVTIFGGSALAISQAVIVETYAVVTFFSIGSYYFVVKKQWYWASAFIGMGVVTHHLIFLTWMALFVFHKELRPFVLKSEFPFIKITNIKPFLITCSFLIFYIYMPLSKMFTDQPNMWGNTTFKSFFTNNISVFTMLIGQIAIYDLPKRILDSLGVLGISLGLGLPIVLWWAFKIKTWKNELLWLFVLPIAWQVGDLAPQCFPKGTTILTRKRIKGKGGKYFEAPIPVPIEKIEVGDEVLSYNNKSGVKEYKKVTHLFRNKTEKTILFKLSNGNEIRCTPNHPMAVNRNGRIEWVEAKDIKNGDEFVQYNYRGLAGRIYSLLSRGKTPEQMYGENGAKNFREKCRNNALASYKNPNMKMNTPERHAKMRASQAVARANPNSGWNSENYRKLVGQRCKERPLLSTPEAKEKVKATKKKQWQNSEFAKMMMKSWRRFPNKKEFKLDEIIKTVSGDFKYNGNVEQGVVIGGRIPDFVNVNGQKKVIELYGDYWHDGDIAQDKIDHYAKYGFQCLIIWEKELKNEELVAQKVKDFTYNPNTSVVHVVSIENITKQEDVYNFEVADNNNYFAYGILVHNCMKYMEASVAWGSIITVTFLAKYGWKWALPVWISAITLLGINANYWDLGRTLDPNLSATQFYEKEIPKMKDGDIFITQGAWEWIEIFLYNKQNDRHIETICMGILASSDYQQMLLDKGIKLTDYDIGDSQASNELNKKQVYVALSIIEQNENVWTSRPTDPATYGSEVVPAKENTDQIKKWLGSANVTPVWHWKPSNPYDCISGAIEVSEWNFILQSSKTVMWLSTYLLIPFIAVWVILNKVFKRKNDGTKSKGIIEWLKRN